MADICFSEPEIVISQLWMSYYYSQVYQSASNAPTLTRNDA